jgi:DNA-binding NarL/FixJ family response regulator
MHTIRLLITGANDPYLWGLRTLLPQTTGITLTYCPQQMAQLAATLDQERVDLLLVNSSKPAGPLVALLQTLHQQYLQLPLVLYARIEQGQDLALALQTGARGYLDKECAISEITEAVQTVLEGHYYYSHRCRELLTRLLAEEASLTAKGPGQLVYFSRQEQEIIRLVCEEYGNKQIAGHMNLSVNSIERLQKKIRDKMGVRSVSGMVLFAMRNGLYGRSGVKGSRT